MTLAGGLLAQPHTAHAENASRQGASAAVEAAPPATQTPHVPESAPLTMDDPQAVIAKALALQAARHSEEALRLMRPAVEALRAQGAPDRLAMATPLYELAEIYKFTGRYNASERIHREALAIREALLPPDHPDIAQSLSALAHLIRQLSRYDEAAALFERSISLYEKSLGPDHPDTALALTRLGVLHERIADYDRAESLYRRALAIQEAALGQPHPELAITLSYLAELHRATARYEESEALHERALAMRRELYGEEHIDIATTLNNLAGLHRAIKAYPEAEALYMQALAMREKLHGPSHPNVASSLNGLAKLYERRKEYDTALDYYLRCLEIREQGFGLNHPKVSKTLNNLAQLHVKRQELDKALEAFLRAQNIQGDTAEMIMGFASKELKQSYLEAHQKSLFRYLSFLVEFFPDDAGAVRQGMEVWLQRKGLLLDSERLLQEALVRMETPEARALFDRLEEIRKEYTAKVLAGPDEGALEAHQRVLAELEAARARAIEELSKLSLKFARDLNRRRADLAAIAAALPPEAVLVDFALYERRRYATRQWDGPHYLAFVLAGDETTGKDGGVDRPAPSPVLVDLGPAAPIENAATSMRKAIQAGDATQATAQARVLHDLLWAPLTAKVPALRATSSVYLSPDGALSFVPFEVFRTPRERWLIEDLVFHYLAAPRDLLAYDAEEDDIAPESMGPALLLGAPDFDADPTAHGGDAPATPAGEALSSREPHTPSSAAMRALVTRAPDLREMRFAPLPATREEVHTIARLLESEHVRVYTNGKAVEEVLYGDQPPLLIHLATHGFFLRDDATSAAGDPDETEEPPATPAPLLMSPTSPMSPLLRSGLALAGANHALDQDAGGRGLLVAEKVLSLPIYGTEIVVLSACSTGMGEVHAGQGVYGLRRAFQQAGARSLVMSLWNVADHETMELMVEFYTNVFTKEMPRADALRQAALTVRQRVMKRTGMDNPALWGAFVFLGKS